MKVNSVDTRLLGVLKPLSLLPEMDSSTFAIQSLHAPTLPSLKCRSEAQQDQIYTENSLLFFRKTVSSPFLGLR